MTEISSARFTICNHIPQASGSRSYESDVIDIFIDDAISASEKIRDFLESFFNRPEHSTSSKIQEEFSYPTETSLKSFNFLNRLTIKNADEIINFLSENNEIIVPVLHGCMLAASNFDSDTQLSLELYSDPEYGDESLRLYVRQENYDNKIMDKIDQIYNSYHKDLMGLSTDFFVTTDFQLPQ